MVNTLNRYGKNSTVSAFIPPPSSPFSFIPFFLVVVVRNLSDVGSHFLFSPHPSPKVTLLLLLLPFLQFLRGIGGTKKKSFMIFYLAVP